MKKKKLTPDARSAQIANDVHASSVVQGHSVSKLASQTRDPPATDRLGWDPRNRHRTEKRTAAPRLAHDSTGETGSETKAGVAELGNEA